MRRRQESKHVMEYYPAQSLVLPITTIRRERRLPREAAMGEVLFKQNSRVESASVVVRGAIPADYVVLDAAPALGLKRDQIITDEMIVASVGNLVDEDDVLVSIGQGRRAKQLVSPIRAVFVRAEGTQVILQSNPDPVEVQAVYPGEIVSVRSSVGVLIESTGALIQCAWGNGKSHFGTFKLEPPGGIESLQGEVLSEYRGNAILMRGPIKSPLAFAVAAAQEIPAIIAGSMHANLRDFALRQTIPVMITDGFGELQMSEIVYNLLRDNMGRQAAFHALQPTRWSTERPEILIPLPSGGQTPPQPETDQPLREGAYVRVTRSPHMGASGRIRRLVEDPRPVENGLRFAGADVQLFSGQIIFVPLANLESLGRPTEPL
jgi:hypothetical protein